MEQGSPEWLAARVGVCTASCFDKIIQPAKLGKSASQIPYRAMLLSEWFLGMNLEPEATQFMERGKALENEARAWYGWEYDTEVQRVGFGLRDDGLVGASPDGLVGTRGMVEIKCLSAQNHVEMLLRDEDSIRNEYRCQRQGQLLVFERDWNDLVLFHPSFPKRVIRTQRDEPFVAKLSECLDEFTSDMLTDRQRFAADREAYWERKRLAEQQDPDPISGDGEYIDPSKVFQTQ